MVTARSLEPSLLLRSNPVSQGRAVALFHLLGLCCGFIEAGLEVRPAMLPSHLDSRFHTVSQDDKLRRPVVVMAAKTHDVHLGHSGRKVARKPGERKGRLPEGRSYYQV